MVGMLSAVHEPEYKCIAVVIYYLPEFIVRVHGSNRGAVWALARARERASRRFRNKIFYTTYLS